MDWIWKELEWYFSWFLRRFIFWRMHNSLSVGEGHWIIGGQGGRKCLDYIHTNFLGSFLVKNHFHINRIFKIRNLIIIYVVKATHPQGQYTPSKITVRPHCNWIYWIHNSGTSPPQSRPKIRLVVQFFRVRYDLLSYNFCAVNSTTLYKIQSTQLRIKSTQQVSYHDDDCFKRYYFAIY